MATKNTFIARVLVRAIINGQRIEIPAGDPLPEGIHDHDIVELKRLRAIEDLAETAAAEKDAAKASKAAQADFDAARAAVQSAAESIKVADVKPPELPPEGGATGGTGEVTDPPPATGGEQDTTGSAGAAGGVGGADLKGAAAPKRQAAATKKKEG